MEMQWATGWKCKVRLIGIGTFPPIAQPPQRAKTARRRPRSRDGWGTRRIVAAQRLERPAKGIGGLEAIRGSLLKRDAVLHERA